MEIIAHRGFWLDRDDRNSFSAIKRAFDNGYGIETDIRDYCGKLVISHDIANENCVSVEKVFECYKSSGCKSTLALNVKADGIQKLLEVLLEKYDIRNYYLFDMSIPELVVNVKENLRFLTRFSDIEPEYVMLEKASGIWLDAFYDDSFMSTSNINKCLKQGKKVFIVSPELHGKKYKAFWQEMKDNNIHENELVVLCTDKPDEAKEFFK